MKLDAYRQRLAEVLAYLPEEQQEAAIEQALLCFATELERQGKEELAAKLRKAMEEQQ